MHLSRLLKAAPFRLAMIYAGLFSLSVLVLMAIVYFATAHLVENQLRATVLAELSALQSELDLDEPAALARAVASRVAAPSARAFAYLLQDPAGRRLAGDLEPMAPYEAWQRLVPAVETTGDDEERMSSPGSSAEAWFCRTVSSSWSRMMPSSLRSWRSCCSGASAGRWRWPCRWRSVAACS